MLGLTLLSLVLVEIWGEISSEVNVEFVKDQGSSGAQMERERRERAKPFFGQRCTKRLHELPGYEQAFAKR